MSDQNIVTDWAAYFESLGPRNPFTGPPITPMFAGAVSLSIMWVKGLDLERHTSLLMEDNLLDEAKALYEAHGCPEMWVFINASGPPWHVVSRPKAVNKPGRKG